MRICFITPEYALYPPFGGIATQIRTMARWMASHGHDVHVICPTRERTPGAENDDGAQVHFVAPRRIKPRRVLAYASKVPGLGKIKEAYYGWDLVENSLGVWLKVRELERHAPFALIQCSDAGGLGFWGVWPLRRSQPLLIRGSGLVIQHTKSGGWPGAWFHNELEKVCARRATFVLTVSYFLAGLYEAEFGISGERVGMFCRIGVLPNVNAKPDLLIENRAELLEQRSPTVLYVGRIEYAKGCDILFQALETVKQNVPAAKVSLVGKVATEFEPQLQTFLQANGDWVTYYGHLSRSEVAFHMQTSTLLVLPSRSETAGGVLAEAQLLGLPQVACRVGGIPEYVEDGATGLLVALDDPQALAEAITRLCLSPDLRATMSQRSKELAAARDNLDTVMERFVKVCDALIAGKSPLTVLQGKTRDREPGF